MEGQPVIRRVTELWPNSRVSVPRRPAMLAEEVAHLPLVLPYRLVEWRLPPAVLGVHVRTSRQERPAMPPRAGLAFFALMSAPCSKSSSTIAG